MGNPYGRSNIFPLVNKSGGSVAAGDLVYLGDGATADSFTTGTTANRTGGIGIAQQTIASNATGLVLLSGYAALVNVNASVTINHYGASYTVAKQATDVGTSRAAGTCLFFLTGGTTPDAIVWQPDLGGGSGMTNPMTNIGDIIQGGTAGAAEALAAPAAGKVLTGAGVTTRVLYSYPPGYEFDYVQTTTPLTVTATTEATAQVFATSNSITYDGSTAVIIEGFAPFHDPQPSTVNILVGVLWDNTAAASLGKISVLQSPAANSHYAPWHVARRLTPASGARVYSWRFFVSSGTGDVQAGAGGVGNYMPGFIRITKAA